MPASNFTLSIDERAQQIERRHKLAPEALGRLDQREVDGKQAIVVPLAGLNSFIVPASEFIGIEPPAKAVSEIIVTALEYAALAKPIVTSDRWSPKGRADELRPLKEAAVLTTAANFEALQDFEDTAAKEEAARYAPAPYPFQLGQTQFQKALADDREIRDLLRGMSVKDRMDVLRAIEGGDAEEGVLRAIRNSPLGMSEELVVAAAAAHKRRIDALDPVGRLKLDEFAGAIDWARRAAGIVASHLLVATGVNGDELADLVHTRRGHEVFGLGRGDIAAAKRRAEIKKHLNQKKAG